VNILVTGPESTGKSTISQFIADQFNAELIPEYARTYLELNGKDYKPDDLLVIAKDHYQLLQRNQQTELRVCDTFLLNIKIWSDVKYGFCDPWIMDHYKKVKFDLVLLTSFDVPWIEDPLRENPENRQELFLMFKRELDAMQQKYIVLESNIDKRQEQVKNLLASILDQTIL